MPTQTIPYGWTIPSLGDVSDLPAAFAAFAADLQNDMYYASPVSFTPSWTSDGSFQPSNPATRVGIYQLKRATLDFYIRFTFGGSTSGGNGALRFGAPGPGRAGMNQFCQCRLLVPNNKYLFGFAEIRGGENTFLPMFPFNETSNLHGYMQNSGANRLPSEATPLMADGDYPIRNGSELIICGSYMTTENPLPTVT